MNVNPNDYSREERRNSSWWSSRHRNSSGAVETVRQARRLTLIDMVLLIVMMGILIPWIVQMDNAMDLGPYRVKIDERSRKNQTTLILKLSLPAETEGLVDETVGWRIYDQAGILLHEEYDLPPMPGKRREFLFSLPAAELLIVEILAGSHSLEIDIGGD